MLQMSCCFFVFLIDQQFHSFHVFSSCVSENIPFTGLMLQTCPRKQTFKPNTTVTILMENLRIFLLFLFCQFLGLVLVVFVLFHFVILLCFCFGLDLTDLVWIQLFWLFFILLCLVLLFCCVVVFGCCVVVLFFL